MFNLTSYLVFLIHVCSLIMANESTIQGHVLERDGNQPLIGANVILKGTNLGSATDMNGNYIIENIPIGKYELKAMFMGFESLEKEIRIEKNQNYTINIKLKSSVLQIKETRVTAEKRKEKVTGAPASIEIISSRDIKRKITTNIGSYLKGLKGIDFTSSGINNYSISIRGFNSSFNTRVLTLTDGRVANIPALRVINYSAIPQSMDDIDRMEVILGPATALYGANAHSGVVNIISKSPAHSEGITMSASGSSDERQLRKINGRWSKKLSNNLSFKLSGMYLHGHEWPYVSETEYKSHLYPWTGNPYRMQDGKDNNPWTDPNNTVLMGMTNDGRGEVIIGNGEQNHLDLDGDGVAGEDWYNGYDDDGDGLIDEDYFTADGEDNDGDCPGDTNGDECYCCTGDEGVDENIDELYDHWMDGYDNDGNGQIDDGRERDTKIAGTNYDPEWGYNMEEKNIIIKGGRSVDTIHGNSNPWYVEGAALAYSDLKGDYYYDEEQVKYLFDVYVYDFGQDGFPGDPFVDLSGDGKFQSGECLGEFGGFIEACDCGLDGICPGDNNYSCKDADGTEGDGIWQPGDGWVDDGDGEVNLGTFGNTQDTYETPNENNYEDVWPPPNGIWDEGEEIQGDYGQDGLENTGDPGENDEILIAWDPGENDNIFDTGDGIYGFQGESWIDCNNDLTICENDENWNDGMGNGRWNEGESFNDVNNDHQYTPPDYMDDFQHVDDVNGDGLNDYPDFEVENYKVEFRLDFDPSNNVNMTFQSGYSWTKTQQVTGTSRYLADGFEYKYYQIRGRFNNWYSQIYMNQSFSGNSRSYNEGNIIDDRSKNYAMQIQRNDVIQNLNTKLVWGLDFFQTLPSTNGSILNDGPNGYDDDGDNGWAINDNIDNDGDGLIDEQDCDDGMVTGIMDGQPDDAGRKDGKPWKCGEGIDERDEFINPMSNEYGIYFQTKTELFETSRFELVMAARLDKHDQLEEDFQFAPKFGLIYKPNEKSSLRFTYGKAFNTPNSITLHTDLFIRKQGILDVYLRGNKNGTPYCRVGQACSGSEDVTISNPGFYYTNPNGDSLFNPISPLESDYFSGSDGEGCEILSYPERVNGAPYFYNISDGSAPNDMIPLDTSRYLIYVPELNGDGILYSPEESFNIANIEPIKTEKIQTLELGYKGFLGKRTQLSMDYYLSYYEDFFSPPTIITPVIVLRDDPSLSIQGILPVNDFNSNAPYGTAWNGKDDDGDWDRWADEFGWGANPDHGEWGFISYDDILDSTNYTIYHPEDVMLTGAGIEFKNFDPQGNPINPSFFDAVGVDEYHPTVGLNEAEMVATIGPNGEQWFGPGVAYSPPHLVLSPMNYGDVWMQGLDISLTHIIPELDIILDGNVSWYGTTDYYNILTKKNDPINAPEWKWNASIKWDSPLGVLGIHYRHVNEFEWSDGIWSGMIGPYDIFDLHYNYLITENLKFSISALNFMDEKHKELIGGAAMGRQLIMRMTSIF